VQPTIRIATGAYAGASRTDRGSRSPIAVGAAVKLPPRKAMLANPESAIESSKESKEVGAGD